MFGTFHIKRQRCVWVECITVEEIHRPIFFLERWIFAKMWRFEVLVSKVWCLLCWKGKFQAYSPSNHDSVEKMCPWKMPQISKNALLVLWIICVKGDSIFNTHPKKHSQRCRRRCAYLGMHPDPNNSGKSGSYLIGILWYPLLIEKNWRSCCIRITGITHGSLYNMLYIYLLRSSFYNNMPNLEMRWLSVGKV